MEPKINWEYNENCKGCIEFQSSEYSSRCLLIDSNKHNNCPCTFCLIKSMCQEPCEDYNDFMMKCIENSKKKE